MNVARAQPVPPSTFEATVDRLLATYRQFKGYDKPLTDDRQAVLRSVVRASFITLTPKPGREPDLPPGARLIDDLTAVHGIWGLRVGDSEGKRQFRLSVKFKPGTRKRLEAAREFTGRWFCHVLLPVQNGGDDNPSFPANEFKWAPRTSCKWSRVLPKIQVSYSDDDETTGEIDLDFDEGANHGTPANSDARAYDSGGTEARHLDELNRVHNQVSASLSLKCQLSRPHGQDRYADTNCP